MCWLVKTPVVCQSAGSSALRQYSQRSFKVLIHCVGLKCFFGIYMKVSGREGPACWLSVDHMLISILSVSVEALEMCAEAAEALAPIAWDWKPDDLLSPLCLMSDLRNPNLSFIQFCHCVISFGACPDFDCATCPL